LVGTYTDPRNIIAYTDGEVRREFNICYTARVTGGQLAISDESTELASSTPPNSTASPCTTRSDCGQAVPGAPHGPYLG
jgi:hypothetical protein